MKKIYLILALTGIFLMSGCITEEAEETASTTFISTSTSTTSTSTSTIASTIPTPSSTSTTVREAGGLYKSAVELYDGGDMLHAKAKAKEALEAYIEINDTEGIARCNALLEAIKIWVEEKTHEAEINYKYASEHYQKALKSDTFEDYEKAIEYAEKAKKLFEESGNKEGYTKSRDLITVIRSDICDVWNFRKGREADSHYEEGVKQFLFAKSERNKSKQIDYSNKAKSEIRRARAIYNQLYEWAKDLGDEEKKKRYLSKIRKCDERLYEIQTEFYVPSQSEREQFYVKANTFFTKGECEKAKELVDNATVLFKKLNDYTGIAKCDALSNHINDCLKMLKKADNYYKKALSFYYRADSVNATIHLNKARAGYDEVDYVGGVKKCDSLEKDITEMSEKKEGADSLMNEAEMLSEHGVWEESLIKAKEAKEIYEEINHVRGVSKACLVINKLSQTPPEPLPPYISFLLEKIIRSPIFMIFILSLLVIAILLIPPLLRRLKK